MKFLHLIFMAFFANYFSLDKMTECVNLLSKFNGKIRPSFEEIFGKGWDEEKKQQKMNESSQQNNGQMGEENGEEKGNDQISENDKQEKQNKSSDQKREDRSEQEKRVIIEKFNLIRDKLKEIGQFPSIKRVKIEHQIGTQLGVCRNKIYKWKREYGKSRKMNKKGNNYYKQKKREFIERMNEFKGMFEDGKPQKIAEELGIGGRTLRDWKRQMGIKTKRKYSAKFYSDQQKRETIEKFHLIKEKLKEIIGKVTNKKRFRIERQIGRHLGVSRNKIFQWKKEFGKGRKMNKKNNNYYKQKKREFIERMDEFIIMMEEGKMEQIVDELGISERTVREWKRNYYT